jgi:periplasmic mercuric ion binding protein
MKKLLLITTFIVILGGAFGPKLVLADDNSVVATTKIVTLNVPGMYCATCPFTVRKSLEKLDGVSNVKTSSATKTATVTYDPAKLAIKDLITATTNVGYPSTVQEAT